MFKIWKTIKLTGKKITKKDLENKGFKVSDYASDMLEKIDFKTKGTFDLVKVKVSDLGFTEYPTTTQICQKAKELGLELCPPEIGPVLRIEYKEQPMGDWFYIAMKQIPDRDGDPRVFELPRREDGLWLIDGWAHSDGEWRLDDGFVFSLSKSSELLKPGKSKGEVFDELDSLKLRIEALESFKDKYD